MATVLGPKKTNLNRSPTNSVPFTRNHPVLSYILTCFFIAKLTLINVLNVEQNVKESKHTQSLVKTI